jgi:hypothetical protein
MITKDIFTLNILRYYIQIRRTRIILELNLVTLEYQLNFKLGDIQLFKNILLIKDELEESIVLLKLIPLVVPK